MTNGTILFAVRRLSAPCADGSPSARRKINYRAYGHGLTRPQLRVNVGATHAATFAHSGSDLGVKMEPNSGTDDCVSDECV